jgi:acyl dehydratase
MKTPEQIHEGDSATRALEVGLGDIRGFARLTGDANPLHLDHEFSAGTRFGAVTAHGQLLASYLVGVVGSELPGPGWFCLGASSDFVRPVFGGDKLTVTVSVRQVVRSLSVVVLDGVVRDAGGRVAVRSQIKAQFLGK